jgi:hypothetical protein
MDNTSWQAAVSCSCVGWFVGSMGGMSSRVAAQLPEQMLCLMVTRQRRQGCDGTQRCCGCVTVALAPAYATVLPM